MIYFGGISSCSSQQKTIVPGFYNPDKCATLLESDFFGFKLGPSSFAVWPIKLFAATSFYTI